MRNVSLLSSNAIQVKNQQKTVRIEDKLDMTSMLEIGEQIVGICHNVTLAHSICTFCDNADRINKCA